MKSQEKLEASQKVLSEKDFQQQLINRFFNSNSYFFHCINLELEKLLSKGGSSNNDEYLLFGNLLDKLVSLEDTTTFLEKLSVLNGFDEFYENLTQGVQYLREADLDSEKLKSEIANLAHSTFNGALLALQFEDTKDQLKQWLSGEDSQSVVEEISVGPNEAEEILEDEKKPQTSEIKPQISSEAHEVEKSEDIQTEQLNIAGLEISLEAKTPQDFSENLEEPTINLETPEDSLDLENLSDAEETASDESEEELAESIFSESEDEELDIFAEEEEENMTDISESVDGDSTSEEISINEDSPLEDETELQFDSQIDDLGDSEEEVFLEEDKEPIDPEESELSTNLMDENGVEDSQESGDEISEEPLSVVDAFRHQVSSLLNDLESNSEALSDNRKSTEHWRNCINIFDAIASNAMIYGFEAFEQISLKAQQLITKHHKNRKVKKRAILHLIKETSGTLSSLLEKDPEKVDSKIVRSLCEQLGAPEKVIVPKRKKASKAKTSKAKARKTKPSKITTKAASSSEPQQKTSAKVKGTAFETELDLTQFKLPGEDDSEVLNLIQEISQNQNKSFLEREDESENQTEDQIGSNLKTDLDKTDLADVFHPFVEEPSSETSQPEQIEVSQPEQLEVSEPEISPSNTDSFEEETADDFDETFVDNDSIDETLIDSDSSDETLIENHDSHDDDPVFPLEESPESNELIHEEHSWNGPLSDFKQQAELYFSIIDDALVALEETPDDQTSLEDLELAFSSLHGLTLKLNLEPLGEFPNLAFNFAKNLLSHNYSMTHEEVAMLMNAFRRFQNFNSLEDTEKREFKEAIISIQHLNSKVTNSAEKVNI